MNALVLAKGHALELNLAVSLAAVVAGLVLYFRHPPDLLKGHSFMRWAFWFLFLRWLCLVVFYGITVSSPTSQRLLLAFVDIGSVCDMAFAWLFVQGDEFSSWATCITASVMLLSLLAWNYFFNPAAHGNLHDLAAGAKWIAFSDAFSSFTLPAVGFAFLLRYRAIVSFLPFLISLAYSVFQRPLYSATLLKYTSVTQGIPDVSGYLLLLVLGKLLLGFTTYSLFFAPVSSYSISTTKIAPEVRSALWLGLRKGLKWLVATLPLHLALAIVAHYLLKFLGLL